MTDSHEDRTIVEQYLEEHGPTSRLDLPHSVRRRHREYGVSVFNIKRRTSEHDPTNGNTIRVYYLEGHDKREVLRTWFDQNDHVLESLTQSSLTRHIGKYGSEWRDAWREIMNEYSVRVAQEAPVDAGKDTDAVCPFCDENVGSRSLSDHLLECSEKPNL